MADEDSANPLLLGWVKEWLDTARERNSKGVTVYRKACDSLRACPLAFQHPSEAQQLHGFGPKLCDRLTDKLKEHCRQNGLPMPEMPQRAKKSVPEKGDGTADAPAKPKRKPKPYVPQLRSGPYGIILALSSLDEDSSTGLTKQETIELAQNWCDTSYTAASDPTKFYTAWNSMKTLVEKDLVCERGRPLKRYFLTEEGHEVAKRIKAALPSLDPKRTAIDTLKPTASKLSKASNLALSKASKAVPKSNRLDDDGFMIIGSSPSPDRELVPEPARPIPNLGNDIIPFGEVYSDETSLPTFSPITVSPSEFTLELVLDVREVRAKEDRDYMRVELQKKGVTPIMRALDVGDCLWIAKFKDPSFLRENDLEGDEVMLDYIVERKRLDDLIGSIKDGRFHEQKFRLRKSGVKNVIYIIEEISMNADHFQRYEEAVESAIASAQVVNGYFIKKTQKMDDTIRYLTRMTFMLKDLYESKPLQLIPTRVLTAQNYTPLLEHLSKKHPSTTFNISYLAFASLASKSETQTLRDVFLKMLMCTRGVTGEKAIQIQKIWKTPYDFVTAYEACGSGEEGKKRKREMVSKEMSHLIGRKKIAKTVSAKIADVWAEL